MIAFVTGGVRDDVVDEAIEGIVAQQLEHL